MTRADRAAFERREAAERSAVAIPADQESASEAVLALQRAAGNAAVTRLIARAPDPAKVDTTGHEEASWARPSTSMATDPLHVATIHFRTKEWAIDAKDEEVLKALATAYAPYASRNLYRPKESQGLQGRIVGYADPRHSSEPDNQTLSEQRATATHRHLLRHLVRASRVIEGHFEIERVGAGVPPEARGPSDDKPAAEGNTLAPFRKAEVFLAGQAVEARPNAPQQADPEDKRAKPPTFDERKQEEWRHATWDKFDAAIERGDKDEIEVMALKMLGFTAGQGDSIDDVLEWTPLVAELRHTIPKIGFTKPPWWDSRGADLLPATGRGGMTERQKLLYKAKLLKRDYLETAKWSEVHFSDRDSSYHLLMREIKKDKPDDAMIKQWVRDLEYLRYMLDATQDSAGDVLKLTR